MQFGHHTVLSPLPLAWCILQLDPSAWNSCTRPSSSESSGGPLPAAAALAALARLCHRGGEGRLATRTRSTRNRSLSATPTRDWASFLKRSRFPFSLSGFGPREDFLLSGETTGHSRLSNSWGEDRDFFKGFQDASEVKEMRYGMTVNLKWWPIATKSKR